MRLTESRVRGVPPYAVFNDVSLHDMVSKRPTTERAFLAVSGVGRKKNKSYGRMFRTAIREYCEDHSLETNVGIPDPKNGPQESGPPLPDPPDELLDELKELRLSLANARGKPAFVVFHDAALHEMAGAQPTCREAFLAIKGAGPRKWDAYGEAFLQVIRAYRERNGLTVSERSVDAAPAPRQAGPFDLFEQGCGLEEVARHFNRGERWVLRQLESYIRENEVESPYPWAADALCDRIAEAAAQVGALRIKTLMAYVDGDATEAEVRICLACLANRQL